MRRMLMLFFCLCCTASTGAAQATVSEVAADSAFRIERARVARGADLVTVFAKLNTEIEGVREAPLISILFETLGDDDPQNDRPRYVWSLTHTRPSAAQRIFAAVPFFYHRSGSKRSSKAVPPPVLDLKPSRWRVLPRLLWAAAQYSVLDDRGFIYRAAPRTYKRNSDDHHREQIHRALTVLSLIESSAETSSVLPAAPVRELQARLTIATSALGFLVKPDALQSIAQKQHSRWERVRGHNWELLRQRAEAEGLYFEPLTLPGGSATHAVLWVARADLNDGATRRFNQRFLNIANPWTDARLKKWEGYVETRWVDAENRRVEPDTPGARTIELIPLALYGLDHPRIPILLVDFRDRLNPKTRNVSRLAIDDAARNVFRISPFRSLHYWLARRVFDLVTHRRGMDFNQQSRLRAQAQLDLLLALNHSVNPELRDEIYRRAKRLSPNPMDNDFAAEIRLAQTQYEALLAELRRPNGLIRKLNKR